MLDQMFMNHPRIEGGVVKDDGLVPMCKEEHTEIVGVQKIVLSPVADGHQCQRRDLVLLHDRGLAIQSETPRKDLCLRTRVTSCDDFLIAETEPRQFGGALMLREPWISERLAGAADELFAV